MAKYSMLSLIAFTRSNIFRKEIGVKTSKRLKSNRYELFNMKQSRKIITEWRKQKCQA